MVLLGGFDLVEILPPLPDLRVRLVALEGDHRQLGDPGRKVQRRDRYNLSNRQQTPVADSQFDGEREKMISIGAA